MAGIHEDQIKQYFSGKYVDDQELKLYKEGDAKKLYKYGVVNDKPWTMFVDENSDMEEIEDAISLATTVGTSSYRRD